MVRLSVLKEQSEQLQTVVYASSSSLQLDGAVSVLRDLAVSVPLTGAVPVQLDAAVSVPPTGAASE
jgi:hypothetical protein